MKKTTGVIFGGRSGEHEISIRSAKTVIEQADPTKYEIVPIAITSEGRWLSPFESMELFPDRTQELYRERYGEPTDRAVALTGDTTVGGSKGIGEQDGVRLDVVFP